MMEEYKIQDILGAALRSESGLALHTENPQESRRMRKRLYAWREQARRQGHSQFDALSILIRDSGTQVWLIPRKEASATVQADLVRPLDSFEVPKKILARGKSRVVKP